MCLLRLLGNRWSGFIALHECLCATVSVSKQPESASGVSGPSFVSGLKSATRLYGITSFNRVTGLTLSAALEIQNLGLCFVTKRPSVEAYRVRLGRWHNLGKLQSCLLDQLSKLGNQMHAFVLVTSMTRA